MFRRLTVAVLLAVLAVPALAQDDSREGRRERGRRGGGPRRGMQRMFERTANELELNDEQRAQYDQLIAEHHERMAGFGELREEMREAMQAGDEERANEIREQMREEFNPGASMEQVFEGLEPILDEDQFDRYVEMRDRFEERRERGRERRERFQQYQEMVEEIPEETEMTDEQREQFDEIIQQRRNQFFERMQGMRPLWQEMRTADEEGDYARVEELRKQMEQLQPDEQKMRNELFDQVETILTEQQKSSFGAYRERVNASFGQASEVVQGDDVRVILMAANKVDLRADQKSAVRNIWRDARSKMEATKRAGAAAQAELASSTKQQIVAVMDAKQVEQYERHIERIKKERRR